MKHNRIVRALRLVTLWIFQADLRLRRAWRRLRGKERYDLTGGCRSCGKCCERLVIHVDRMVWYFPTMRRTFLWWQREAHGFELVSEDRGARSFVFACSHLDPVTRLCDDYDTRPGICRDYPRALLGQPWPEFFDGCGLRPVARKGAALDAALDGLALSDEKRAELRRKLRIE